MTLLRVEDMYAMFDMFKVGQMVLLATTDDVYIRTRRKWKLVRKISKCQNLSFKIYKCEINVKSFYSIRPDKVIRIKNKLSGRVKSQESILTFWPCQEF